MFRFPRLIGLVICGFLVGCAGDGSGAITALAANNGFARLQVPTDVFVLTAYRKITAPTQPIDVYIEGDGLAWLSDNQPSANPTPHKALGLRLATHDLSPNVLYIARPCQFTPFELDGHCSETYWTDRRFSEEVIRSVNQAIDKLTAITPRPRLNLIGYSGGGAVAVLVAARRSDVVSLRTVAGNLDHEEVNRLNEVSPLEGSLNAIDQAKKVQDIPQLHFSGSEDEIVPPSIAARFIAAMSSTRCARARIIESASHENGWEEVWQNLLRDKVACSP
jgi:hypothetical protein